MTPSNRLVTAAEDRGDGRLRMFDLAASVPWDTNGHGMWCPECGWSAAPIWFFDEPDYEPPTTCRDCGYPHD